MYNGEGNLSPWWTEKTNGEYEARATCFIKQYSSFQVPSTNPNNSPVANVNGNFTLTENIADNGGVNLAFDALQLYLKTNGASKSTTTTTTTTTSTTSTTNLRGNCEDAGADGSSGSGNSGSNEGEIDAEKTFFLAFAQSWCEKGTDQHWLSQISSDPHSPGVFRANGVIMNNHHFGRVFNCPVGSKMNPQEKCEIW
jgi:endothelin-converting enzyme